MDDKNTNWQFLVDIFIRLIFPFILLSLSLILLVHNRLEAPPPKTISGSITRIGVLETEGDDNVIFMIQNQNKKFTAISNSSIALAKIGDNVSFKISSDKATHVLDNSFINNSLLQDMQK